MPPFFSSPAKIGLCWLPAFVGTAISPTFANKKMMLKKYAPYILLLAAAALFFFLKQNQRGPAANQNTEISTEAVSADEGFNRNPDSIIYTKHARCRMQCRHITEPEVKEILQTGKVNSRKIEEDERGKTYPLEGKTAQDKMLRVVVAPKRKNIVVVTVIDLDTNWPCGDCK
jgi:hypothetical protein